MSEETPTRGGHPSDPATTVSSAQVGGDPVLAFLAGGIPFMGEDSQDAGTSHEQAQELAMAFVAVALMRRHDEMLPALVEELTGLDEHGGGVALAVDHLTSIRFCGMPRGLPPSTVYVGPQVPAPDLEDPVQQQHYRAALAAVTKLWSGHAGGDRERYAAAVAELRDAPRELVTAGLTIMAEDVAARLNWLEEQRSLGFEGLENRLRAAGHELPADL